MRKPDAISPSAFMQWEKDPDEYALKYLTEPKPPRMPQPLAASVGSSFDAYVKHQLHGVLFGYGSDPQFEFDTLFESQVESHNRDEAREMGKRAFYDYMHTGSYDELLLLMQGAQEAPQFEFDAELVIDGVPIMGKPDCRFVDMRGNHIILDWKVKGYCSKYGASPTKGYRMCRDGRDWEKRNITKRQRAKLKEAEESGKTVTIQGKQSTSNGKTHDLYLPFNLNGVEVNMGFLETCNAEYATQLSIYGWIMGEEVGDEEVIVCIDEIVGKYMDGDPPLLRVANHRARVSKGFQLGLLERIKKLWSAIDSGHIFQDVSREESDERLSMLEMRAKGMTSSGSDEDDWFSQMGRSQY